MAELFVGLLGAAGKVATAAVGAAAPLGAAAPPVGTAVAGGGLSLAQILSGTATLLSVVGGISAANAEASALEEQAKDAMEEQAIENVQGVARRASLRRELMDAVGAQDVAYAASGTDLSFGTAAQARSEAWREGDMALDQSEMTTLSRTARLEQRADAYRRRAKQTRGFGLLSAATQGLTAFARLGA